MTSIESLLSLTGAETSKAKAQVTKVSTDWGDENISFLYLQYLALHKNSSINIPFITFKYIHAENSSSPAEFIPCIFGKILRPSPATAPAASPGMQMIIYVVVVALR